MKAIKEFLKSNRWKVSVLLLVVAFLFSPVLLFGIQINLGDNPNFNPSGPGIKVIIVAPPEVFTLPGSETTNFIQVCTLGEALNIVLDVVGKNKVEFQEPIIDMCDNETMENLDKYIQLDKVGEVTVDSDSLPYFKNKSAVITMRNLPFEEEPDIEVDGRLVTEKDIGNKVWDESSKNLTFEAKHFTTYKAVAKAAVSLDQKEEMDINTLWPIRPSFGDILKMVAIIGFIVIIAVALVYLILKKKKEI